MKRLRFDRAVDDAVFVVLVVAMLLLAGVVIWMNYGG